MRNLDSRLGTTCEAIVLSETHEMYIWVLCMQADIENKRNLKEI